MQDPQSLHKYLYVHGDPIQGRDPTGLVSLGGLGVSMSISGNVRSQNQASTASTHAVAQSRLAHTLGQLGERLVRLTYNIGNKVRININGRARIPDGLTRRVLTEIKNVKRLSYTRQLRDYVQFAQQTGRRVDLFVRSSAQGGTRLSGPLQEAINNGLINLRFIP